MSRRGVSRAAIYYLLEGPAPPLPVVTIVATIPDAYKEGPIPGEMTISRTGAVTDPLTVYYGVSGTATPDVDYFALSGIAVIPAGASSIAIPVMPITELDVLITLVATVTPCSKVGPTNGEFTITRTGPLDDALVVEYLVSGSAIPGVDYVPLSGSVTIPAGEASATITIVPIP